MPRGLLLATDFHSLPRQARFNAGALLNPVFCREQA